MGGNKGGGGREPTRHLVDWLGLERTLSSSIVRRLDRPNREVASYRVPAAE